MTAVIKGIGCILELTNFIEINRQWKIIHAQTHAQDKLKVITKCYTGWHSVIQATEC